MVNQGVLHVHATESVIGSLSVLHPESEGKKRNIISELLLTALIDAFSILVIFLLMSFSSTGEILFLGKGTELPKSGSTSVLERFPVVRIDEGKLYLEDKEVEPSALTSALLDIRTEWQKMHPGEEYANMLTVQADRRVKFEVMNSIVVAASQSGFSDLKFAALVK